MESVDVGRRIDDYDNDYDRDGFVVRTELVADDELPGGLAWA